MTAPLAGIRVIEAARFITGPYAAMLLADLGATVIKVEAPGQGDPFRSWGGAGVSPRFLAYNRGKQSVTLDLSHPAGREALRRLVQTADVFIENFRPGVTARLGIEYPALAAANPRLIYCSISGFGPDGPLAHRPAYDAVGQAVSGLMSLLVEPGRPHPIGPALSDGLTGLFAAYGILAALQARDRTGRGQYVQTSMLQATVAFLTEPAVHYFQTGEVPDAWTRPRMSQSFGFVAADHRALVVHLSTLDKFWRALVSAVGRPELADDPRFAEYGNRVANYAALHAELSPVFRTRPRADWLARLAAADIPCAPVYTLDEVFADPQVRHLGLAVPLPSSGTEHQRTVAPAVALADLPPPRPAPALGEHTIDTLRAIGYAAAQLEALRGEGVI
ncbi:MAG TPA: CaiB/BaiF CoA-transferase family protein [Chloroflexota bacterium]|jgi:crotonobetainyl-CoA:carnitine CoA-transferase CaiB-like acyl-CoA transferase|nr:CaiB/BaiF CoA-transferase family protein [Chloroflexota bacterium]